MCPNRITIFLPVATVLPNRNYFQFWTLAVSTAHLLADVKIDRFHWNQSRSVIVPTTTVANICWATKLTSTDLFRYISTQVHWLLAPGPVRNQTKPINRFYDHEDCLFFFVIIKLWIPSHSSFEPVSTNYYPTHNSRSHRTVQWPLTLDWILFATCPWNKSHSPAPS